MMKKNYEGKKNKKQIIIHPADYNNWSRCLFSCVCCGIIPPVVDIGMKLLRGVIIQGFRSVTLWGAHTFYVTGYDSMTVFVLSYIGNECRGLTLVFIKGFIEACLINHRSICC